MELKRKNNKTFLFDTLPVINMTKESYQEAIRKSKVAGTLKGVSIEGIKNHRIRIDKGWYIHFE